MLYSPYYVHITPILHTDNMHSQGDGLHSAHNCQRTVNYQLKAWLPQRVLFIATKVSSISLRHTWDSSITHGSHIVYLAQEANSKLLYWWKLTLQRQDALISYCHSTIHNMALQSGSYKIIAAMSKTWQHIYDKRVTLIYTQLRWLHHDSVIHLHKITSSKYSNASSEGGSVEVT